MNAERGRESPEYELVDTGVFDDDAYFDIVIEYAKAGPEDMLIRLTITNRSAQRAPLHVLPTFWYRNEWSWRAGVTKPTIGDAGETNVALVTQHPTLGRRWMIGDGNAVSVLYTENDTNYERAFGVKNPRPFVKDAFGRYLINNDPTAINPKRTGTKAAFQYTSVIEPGATDTIRLRLTDSPGTLEIDPVAFDAIVDRRIAEADEFYNTLLPATADPEDRTIQRRAFAGLLWTKQFYNYIIRDWLKGDPLMPPPPPSRLHGRNSSWPHLYNDEVLSMPDEWEYPWYASWDLAFHVIAFALIDPDFAKRQLVALTRERYMHPNGQLPAYEWAFDDVNPPVHAWAAYRIYKIEAKRRGGVGDMPFLERVFQKLLLNFTWWVNRKDVAGRNVFQGGFLGLDNIGVFDRSTKLPTGGYLAQADGTAWMAVYSLNMLAIAIELARHDPVYEHLANKFFEHFLYIADAMNAQNATDDLGHRAVGSAGRVLLRPALLADRRTHPAQGAVGRRRHPDLRGRNARPRHARKIAAAENARRVVHRQSPGAGGKRRAHRDQRHAAAPAAGDREPRPAAPHPAPGLRRRRILEPQRNARALEVPRCQPVRAQRRRREFPRRLRTGRIDQRLVRRKLQLARTDLVSAQLPADRVAAEIPLLLGRRVQDRVSDRIGNDADTCGRSRSSSRTA